RARRASAGGTCGGGPIEGQRTAGLRWRWNLRPAGCPGWCGTYSDLPFSWPSDRLLLLMAGGRDALLCSVEGAEDSIDQAVRLVQRHEIGFNDVVIAVAASGTTPFTLACLREAKRQGALTIGVANNRDTPILEEADHAIWLDTGAEPIAGSTRMKAGTAQRITLNVFSSLVMILLGRVYEGLMVDVQAVNQKR